MPSMTVHILGVQYSDPQCYLKGRVNVSVIRTHMYLFLMSVASRAGAAMTTTEESNTTRSSVSLGTRHEAPGKESRP